MNLSKKVISRRKFTKLSAAAAGSLPLMGFQNNLLGQNNADQNNIHVSLFSKHLQFLDYNDMSEAAAEIGFDGLDLTVRSKGHVLPERVVDDLPKAIEAMKKIGLQPKLMTTNVWDANTDEDKTVLTTASRAGIKYYRTGWLKYAEDKSIDDSQQLFGQQAKKLEALNNELGLIGC